jgi:two-component sensor histidine kinase
MQMALSETGLASRTGLHSGADPRSAGDLAFRQLRHLTRNALQRIIGSIHHLPELTRTAEGRRLASEIERAICTSAAISDALFGLTRDPGPMAERLRSLCTCLLTLFADPDQSISLDVEVEGVCPPELRVSVVRVANELVGNALKHGMCLRSEGRIAVRLSSDRKGRTILRVTDDGLGAAAAQDGGRGGGEGLRLARAIAAGHGGRVTLRHDTVTTAELELPGTAPSAGEDPPPRDAAVIAALFAVLILAMAAVDSLTTFWPSVRSFCLGGVLLAGRGCSPTP